jgi:hypothetical protein
MDALKDFIILREIAGREFRKVAIAKELCML